MNPYLNKSRTFIKVRDKSITLIELLVAMAMLGILILGFSSIDLFSRYHALSSERRAKLQNEVSYALAHMNKNVAQGMGNVAQPPLEAIANSGFRVRVDRNIPPTPQILTDDTWLNYTLSNNTLSFTWDSNTEPLSNYIVSGVVSGIMPSDPDTGGFYINLTENGSVIEVGLVARFDPAVAKSVDNPQVAMKTRLYARGAAAR